MVVIKGSGSNTASHFFNSGIHLLSGAGYYVWIKWLELAMI